MIRLNRKQKTRRNSLLVLFILLALWMAAGFPPYTVGAMCRRVQEQYLLPEVEPLYFLRDRYGDEMMTYVIAKAGNEYLEFQYARSKLIHSEPDGPRSCRIERGPLCTARKGMLYVAGAFEEAVSASAVVTAERKVEEQVVETKLYPLEGERLGGGVLGFYYGEYAFLFDEGLTAQVWDWYSISRGGGRGLLHDTLPCTVTFYDAAGEIFETVDLEVGTYDLISMR